MTNVNLPVQITPFPVNPELQIQIKSVGVSKQEAFTWQLCVPNRHSSRATNKKS